MTETVQIPRMAKGKRPTFFDDPAVDQMMAIIIALTGELSVVYDRLDSLERVLESDGKLDRAKLEAYVPDEASDSQRAKRRAEYIGRVFRVIREQPETFSAAEAEAAVEQMASASTD